MRLLSCTGFLSATLTHFSESTFPLKPNQSLPKKGKIDFLYVQVRKTYMKLKQMLDATSVCVSFCMSATYLLTMLKDTQKSCDFGPD